MAKSFKKNKPGYASPTRNRGEDIGTPRSYERYDYMPEDQYTPQAQQRAIGRSEVRERTDDLYQLEQERSQRAYQKLSRMENEFFAGIDPRRRKEVADSGMVQEDHRQIANLSDRFIHAEYPRSGYYSTPYLDDGVRGLTGRRDDNGEPL